MDCHSISKATLTLLSPVSLSACVDHPHDSGGGHGKAGVVGQTDSNMEGRESEIWWAEFLGGKMCTVFSCIFFS